MYSKLILIVLIGLGLTGLTWAASPSPAPTDRTKILKIERPLLDIDLVAKTVTFTEDGFKQKAIYNKYIIPLENFRACLGNPETVQPTEVTVAIDLAAGPSHQAANPPATKSGSYSLYHQCHIVLPAERQSLKLLINPQLLTVDEKAKTVTFNKDSNIMRASYDKYVFGLGEFSRLIGDPKKVKGNYDVLVWVSSMSLENIQPKTGASPQGGFNIRYWSAQIESASPIKAQD